MKNLVPRTISGLIYIIFIWAGTTIHPYGTIALMGFFFLMTFIEFTKITQFKSRIFLPLVFLAACFVIYHFSKGFLFAFERVGYFQFLPNSISFIGPVLFAIAGFTIFFFTEELMTDFGKATIAVVYLAVPFALALTFPSFTYHFGNVIMNYEILMVFVLIWISDTFAYLVGSKFGKTKLAPKISENKSVEGFLGGLVFTVLAGFLIHHYYESNLQGDWRIIGGIVGIMGPVGDLAESRIKRFFGVKDSGNFIPGHGGFLDRLDSFIFTAPFVYLYLLLNYIL